VERRRILLDAGWEMTAPHAAADYSMAASAYRGVNPTGTALPRLSSLDVLDRRQRGAGVIKLAEEGCRGEAAAGPPCRKLSKQRWRTLVVRDRSRRYLRELAAKGDVASCPATKFLAAQGEFGRPSLRL